METRQETPEGLGAVLFVQDESSDASILEKEKQHPTPGKSLKNEKLQQQNMSFLPDLAGLETVAKRTKLKSGLETVKCSF